MGKNREAMNRELPGWVNGMIIAGVLGSLLLAEWRRPLRKTREPKLRHDTRNVAFSMMTAATIQASEAPLAVPLARWVERRRRGLLKIVRLPAGLDLLLSVVLLDYTLYVWHYLTHKVPFLWRFHQAHHVDLDLDASTALRFHPGEMLLSVPWRLAQILLIGVSPRALSIWQTATLAEILFHHSNVRLPAGFERRFCRLIVSPRMHGIHHSIVREETDSNWSTIFSWPDYLHGTIRLNVPQGKITIGVPAYQDPAELTVGSILKMPATAERPSWYLAGGGRPRREQPASLPETILAD